MIPVAELERALNSIEAPTDPQERLGLVLNWLGGSGNSEHLQRLQNKLGPSDERPNLMLAVHDWLDQELFLGATLDEAVAGVGPERSQDQRRRRYRQLLGAFHPDRHPELGERLTERLQAINQAYTRFKRFPDADEELLAVPATAGPISTVPRPYEGIAPDRSHEPQSNWRQRWGQDRFLGHKLVLLMALLAMFPLVSMYLDDAPDRVRPAELAASLAAETGDRRPPRRLPEGVNVRIDHWPPVLEPQPWREAVAEEFQPPAEDTLTFLELDQPEVPAWVASLRQPRTWMGGLGELIRRSDLHLRELWANPPRLETSSARSLDASAGKTEDATATSPGPGQAEVDSSAKKAEVFALRPESGAATEPPAVARAELTAAAAPSQALSEAAATASADKVEFIAPESIQQASPTRAGGELHLGILATHEAGRVLTALQQSIEDGDIDRLLELLSPSASETRGRGRGWFEQHYGELFGLTTHRALSLEVLSARRDGDVWRVEARYEFVKVASDDTAERRKDGLVLYTLQAEHGQMRIEAVDYQ